MSKSSYFKTKKFNAPIRALSFSKIPNCTFKCKCNKIIAELPIRYENESYKYKLKILIDNYGYYKCYIISPKISYKNGMPPHIYFSDSKLDEKNKIFKELRICLHLPSSNEYSVSSSIVETIVSWAIKWTEFYELWLLTGVWYGGGKHVSDDTEKMKLSKEAENK